MRMDLLVVNVEVPFHFGVSSSIVEKAYHLCRMMANLIYANCVKSIKRSATILGIQLVFHNKSSQNWNRVRP